MVASLVAHGVAAAVLLRWLGTSGGAAAVAAIAAMVPIAPRDDERAPMTVVWLVRYPG